MSHRPDKNFAMMIFVERHQMAARERAENTLINWLYDTGYKWLFGATFILCVVVPIAASRAAPLIDAMPIG